MSSSDSSLLLSQYTTAKELADYLFKIRFQNDDTKTAIFLLQAMEKIPNVGKLSSQIVDSITSLSTKEKCSSEKVEDFEMIETHYFQDTLSLPITSNCLSKKSVEVSATIPRGKFSIELSAQSGLMLKNIKGERLYVSPKDVQNLIIFPKPEDCRGLLKKKKGSSGLNIPGSMVLVLLGHQSHCTFRNKIVKQVCFQLTNNVTMIESASKVDYDSLWVDVLALSLALKADCIVRVFNPLYTTYGVNVFTSEKGDGKTSTTSGGLPYIKCYSGVNDGVLYPLEDGLLFFKPPKFIHRSQLHSISAGRGSGGSRFVDLVATMDTNNKNTDSIEFTNIDREELTVLNNYIHEVLVKAMAQDAAKVDGKGSDHENCKSSLKESMLMDTCNNITEENDYESGIVKTNVGRQKSTRIASWEAQIATRAMLAQHNHVNEGSDNDEFEDSSYCIGDQVKECGEDSDDDNVEEDESFYDDIIGTESDESQLADEVCTNCVNEYRDNDLGSQENTCKSSQMTMREEMDQNDLVYEDSEIDEDVDYSYCGNEQIKNNSIDNVKENETSCISVIGCESDEYSSANKDSTITENESTEIDYGTYNIFQHTAKKVKRSFI